MWPDRVSNPGPLTYESGALMSALRGLAFVTLTPWGPHMKFGNNCPSGFRGEVV